MGGCPRDGGPFLVVFVERPAAVAAAFLPVRCPPPSCTGGSARRIGQRSSSFTPAPRPAADEKESLLTSNHTSMPLARPPRRFRDARDPREVTAGTDSAGGTRPTQRSWRGPRAAQPSSVADHVTGSTRPSFAPAHSPQRERAPRAETPSTFGTQRSSTAPRPFRGRRRAPNAPSGPSGQQPSRAVSPREIAARPHSPNAMDTPGTTSSPAVAEFPAVESFDSLPIAASTRDAVAAMGIVTPTPIQARTLSALLAGRDVIGQARTGS